MIHRFRIDVLEHIVKNIAHYTPRELNALLKDYISQFPHEVFFIKKLIDRSTPYAARLFLNQIPTSDKGVVFLHILVFEYSSIPLIKIYAALRFFVISICNGLV